MGPRRWVAGRRPHASSRAVRTALAGGKSTCKEGFLHTACPDPLPELACLVACRRSRWHGHGPCHRVCKGRIAVKTPAFCRRTGTAATGRLPRCTSGSFEYVDARRPVVSPERPPALPGRYFFAYLQPLPTQYSVMTSPLLPVTTIISNPGPEATTCEAQGHCAPPVVTGESDGALWANSLCGDDEGRGPPTMGAEPTIYSPITFPSKLLT